MLTTSISSGHLAGECNLWIDTLRAFRNKFQNYKTVLPGLVHDQLQKDVLLEIEHLDNQLHIQLINIHDLKLSVKKHMQQLLSDRLVLKNHISDDSFARHDYLNEEYQRQETTLHNIAREFERFLTYMSGKKVI